MTSPKCKESGVTEISGTTPFPVIFTLSFPPLLKMDKIALKVSAESGLKLMGKFLMLSGFKVNEEVSAMKLVGF
jgi:hypothetical protein